MPKVSIIVPTYNVEQYLRECMDSLIGQTLEDIEIICVNDGSTDGSLAILREYAARDSRIKIIDKPNGGYGHSMNVGIDAATGEYMGIVEPDDYVLPNMYEELYEQAKKHDAEIVKADFYRFTTTGREPRRDYNQLTKNGGYYNRIINPSEEQYAFKFVMNTWSGIYRLSFIKENNIRHNETPGASFQDNGFWFQGFCLAHRLLLVDKPYYMNRRDNPNSSVTDKNKVYCANEEYRFIRCFLENSGLYEKFKSVYVMKAWHNYWFTFKRIGAKFKLGYLKTISKEFKGFIANGDVVPSLFGKNELRAMDLIVRSPFLFFCGYGFCRKLKLIR